MAVTAYEPKRCETIRTVLPIRGNRGVSAWIKWEVEVGTARRRRELSRRLREAQKVLSLKGSSEPRVTLNPKCILTGKWLLTIAGTASTHDSTAATQQTILVVHLVK